MAERTAQLDADEHGVRRGEIPGQHPPPDLIREELNHVLSSREFSKSKRCCDFLRYAVESVLHGQADKLKERTIAMEVFGRDSSYEPSEDATARVVAGEIRKRLGMHYSSQPPRHGVIIDLPAGAYIPEFHFVAAKQEESSAIPEPLPTPSPVVLPKHRKLGLPWRFALLALLPILAFVLFMSLRGRHAVVPPEPTLLERFWQPVLDGKKPVAICASFVPVYTLMVIRDPGQRIRAEDYSLIPNQFLAIGDLKAQRQIADMMGNIKRPYTLQVGNETTFAQLRSGPAVLVGYAYTEWDDINKSFPFFVDMDRTPSAITENGMAKWILKENPDDPKLTEDYALVSRVFDTETRNYLIEVSGISHYGTEAAADFVSNPGLLAEALKAAPAGWENENVQFVLHVRVVNGAAGTPEVIAARYWQKPSTHS